MLHPQPPPGGARRTRCFPPSATAQTAPRGPPPGMSPHPPGDKPDLRSLGNPLLIRRTVTNNANCFTPFTVPCGIRYSTDNNELTAGPESFCYPTAQKTRPRAAFVGRPLGKHTDSNDISTIHQSDCSEDPSLSIGF